jgi:Sec-independent protein secretion pathway component TatC
MNPWLVGARPRTLPAAVVPVAIGAGCAVGAGSVTWWRVGVALVVVGAALLPTVDPVSLAFEVVPLLLLYAFSVALAAFFERRWAAKIEERREAFAASDT